MRVARELKEVICRSTSPKLKEVLENELEEFIAKLKMTEDYHKLRFNQGYVRALDDIIELLTQK